MSETLSSAPGEQALTPEQEEAIERLVETGAFSYAEAKAKVTLELVDMHSLLPQHRGEDARGNLVDLSYEPPKSPRYKYLQSDLETARRALQQFNRKRTDK